MKKTFTILCLAAMLLGIGSAAQAQFRQSIFLNGNIPTGAFASSASNGPNLNVAFPTLGTTVYPTTGVPLTYEQVGKDASVGFGLGYRGKNFYADFAYKYRAQKGDFYAFDDYLQRTGSTADYGQFMAAAGQSLAPQNVDLSRHTITFTLGVKF